MAKDRLTVDDRSVKLLESAGYSEDEARAALRQTVGDVHGALDLLANLSGGSA